MSKRFIDSNLFNDEYFMSLSKDGKLFFIYFITNCDHAGILKLNKKLIQFQTDIECIETVIEELGNSLVTLKENTYFMPKYIKFQYPDFPKSNVKQQDSALKILISYGLFDVKTNSILTVSKELKDSYDNDNVIVNESLIENRVKSEIISELSGQNIFYKRTFEEIKDFFREELKQAPESDPVTSEFNKLCLFMFKDGFLGEGINNLRLFSHLMTFDEYKHLIKMGVTNKFIQECLESMANDDSYTQKKNSLFLTLKNWYNRKQK
jgi:hypothetical protein